MARLKPLLIAVAVAVAPSGAAAETFTGTHRLPNGETYRTDCYSGRRYSHCSTTVVRPRSDPKILAEGQRLLAEKAARQRDPRYQDAEFQSWRTTQLLAAPDCPGARAYAAATERADLVSRVAEFCGKESN